jgi:hypothetical protein
MEKVISKTQKYNLFPIELYVTNLNIDNTTFIQELYNLKSTSPGVNKSNKGGWQSEELIHNINFEFLRKTILNIIIKTFNTDISLFQMWGNISSKYHYNAIHHHGRHPNLWSGVYYLQTFKNSGYITIHSHWDTDLNKHFNFSPGTLIFFPSNLPHSVDANMENQDRISIAFNFKIG